MKKSPVETAKDAAKTVDRMVSDKLVDGIEIGRMFALPSLSTSQFPFGRNITPSSAQQQWREEDYVMV